MLLLFLFFLWSLRKDQMMVSFCVEVLMLVLVKVEWLVWLVELVWLVLTVDLSGLLLLLLL